MCVFARSLVAEKANLSSELSKCKQSKSILKIMEDICHLKPKTIAISVLLCKLRSFKNS